MNLYYWAEHYEMLFKTQYKHLQDLFCNSSGNQIGRSHVTDDTGKNSLKEAMEKARRKMEEGTPDASPNSSRGCSPYPELYTGPHLMEAIQSLELSPANTPTPAETPTPNTAWNFQKAKKDGEPINL